jgi:TetR/AcrR family transcriptional regulator, acrAB operon repressor
VARRTKKEAQATRESVLTAALDLFAEKGYSRTTCSDIGRRIGMTRGAVYWHFDGKAALLAALIDYVHELKEQKVKSQIPDIETLEDLRKACILHAQLVEKDPVIRKFEFFLTYQMEWSEELLEETRRNMNELRENPLEQFRACFNLPKIATRLKPGVDADHLVLTLASFWVGACKMCLGSHFPDMKFGRDARTGMSFSATVECGFDLIMSGILKKEITDE